MSAGNGALRLALPSSTRKTPVALASGTPSATASSNLTLFITLAALAAPISEPAPRTESMSASSPLPLRTWCTTCTAQPASLASWRNMATTFCTLMFEFSLTSCVEINGSMMTKPMLFALILSRMWLRKASLVSMPSLVSAASVMPIVSSASIKSLPAISGCVTLCCFMAAASLICISAMSSSRLTIQTFVGSCTFSPSNGRPVTTASASTIVSEVLPMPPADAVTLTKPRMW